jgi:hypothetical protein
MARATDDARRWAQIKAEYSAGASVSSICAKYGLTFKELLDRIEADGWIRGEPPPNAKFEPDDHGSDFKPPATLEAVRRQKSETVSDILKRHKRLSEQLGQQVELELAELQAMQSYAASFLNDGHIEQLQQECGAKQDWAKLLAYLTNAMKARKLSADLLEKVARTISLLVQFERKAWGLEDDAGEAEQVSYDDLLEQIRTPFQNRELPDNIVRFDEKLKRRKLQ